jgi:predicted neuraminidase
MPFIFSVNYDQVVATLPSCVSKENRAKVIRRLEQGSIHCKYFAKTTEGVGGLWVLIAH